MDENGMKKKILGNELSIKGLIERIEKMNNKIRKMSDEIKTLRRENRNLKNEVLGLQAKLDLYNT